MQVYVVNTESPEGDHALTVGIYSTEEKAVDAAATAQGVVGSLGGDFTAKLITGKFESSFPLEPFFIHRFIKPA